MVCGRVTVCLFFLQSCAVRLSGLSQIGSTQLVTAEDTFSTGDPLQGIQVIAQEMVQQHEYN